MFPAAGLEETHIAVEVNIWIVSHVLLLTLIQFKCRSALYEDKSPTCLISLWCQVTPVFICLCENQLYLKTKHQDNHSQKQPLKFKVEMTQSSGSAKSFKENAW